ncbi:hypothetical protein V5799_027821 [Amblyomma americanum]|uniref:Secreted protein n=1 Tax=Amblyomma americanum TaxID=6943 RepID=A0AAQ4DEM2_AMBAM
MRRSKITMTVAASLLVLVVLCVALGFMFGGPRRDDLLDFGLRQPAVARDVMENFNAVNASVAVVWVGDWGRPTVGVSPELHQGRADRAQSVKTTRPLD